MTEIAEYAGMNAGDVNEPLPECEPCGYIEDDFVLHGEFPGHDGLPRVRFQYHPIGTGESLEYQREMLKALKSEDPRKITECKIKKLLLPYLKGWDMRKPKKPSGEPGDIVDHTQTVELFKCHWMILDYICTQIIKGNFSADSIEKK